MNGTGRASQEVTTTGGALVFTRSVAGKAPTSCLSSWGLPPTTESRQALILHSNGPGRATTEVVCRYETLTTDCVPVNGVQQRRVAFLSCPSIVRIAVLVGYCR